jgi:predicted RNA binding protein YcfA (HicA-like mRNA interferase family)
MRALRKIGHEFDRQNGSHMILRQVVPPYWRLVAADHKKIAQRTLRAIIRQAGSTVERFRALL